MGLLPGYDVEVIYPAPLACPDGIALTPSGDFLIAENHTGCIKKVTPDGKVSTVTILPTPATAVAYNPQGEPFVGGNGGIWKLSPEGKPAKFSDVGVSKMAFGPDGYLYTINWHGGPHPEIMKISPQGKATTFFTGLSRPSDIAFSPSGELFVTDPGSGNLYKFDGDERTTVVVTGLWTDPSPIAFDRRGNLFLRTGWRGKTENGLYKVSLPSGSITPIILMPPMLSGSDCMAIDDSGNMFLPSCTYGTIQKVTPEGDYDTLVEYWHNPEGLVVGPSGNLFIADHSQTPFAPGRILELDMGGNVTTFFEGLEWPMDLAFDGSGNLFIADLWAGKVFKITLQGQKQIFADNIPGPESIAFDATSGDFFVYAKATDEVLRISEQGEISLLPVNFGKDVRTGRVAVDSQGNLLVCVVYMENIGLGPTLSSLFKITSDGNVKLLAEFTDEVPCCEVDLAISPSGHAFLLAHPLDGFVIRKVTPEGEVSVFATQLPVDPFGIAINAEADIFFSCSPGIYRIFRTG